MKETPMAFPCTEYNGMTLRDYFAAAALQGMIANPDISEAMTNEGMKPFEIRHSFACSAYAQADEMLKSRNEK